MMGRSPLPWPGSGRCLTTPVGRGLSLSLGLRLRGLGALGSLRFQTRWLREFINDILYRYCCREALDFTRSRPYHKNDNAYIDEKNYTHVRKTLGYLRYDTLDELLVMNELYRGALRLYKNFFQSVMKLVYKERIEGHTRRKYDTPKTPYQRLLESKELKAEDKQKLRELYESLNPAELKQEIEAKVEELMKAYEQKRRIQQAEPNRKQKPRVTCLMI